MSISSLNSSSSDVTVSTVKYSSISRNKQQPIILTFDKCPRCKVQYDFHKRVNVSRVPLILTCNHTVCEDCILRMYKSNEPICPLCGEKFVVTRTQVDNLTEHFQPHFSLIGQLAWTKNMSNISRKHMNFVSSGQTLGSRCRGTGDFPEMNLEMEEFDSDDGDYEKCTLPLIFEKCSDHSDQFENIRCEDCDGVFCCYCFLENHSGHKPSHLYKLSEDEKDQLEKFKHYAELVQAQLIVSNKRVKELKTFDMSHVENDIKKFFTNLHAKLYLTEMNMKKNLLDMEASGDIDLDTVTYTLKSNLYRVNQILEHFNMIPTKKVNLRALYDEVENVKNTPCRLVSDQGALQPIQLETDEVLNNIEDHIYLKRTSSMQYNLQPVEDWEEATENYELEKMKQRFEEHLCEVQPETSGYNQQARRFEDETKKLPEGRIRVVVTHINNLNSFFVQKYNKLGELEEMNYNIGKRIRRRTGYEDYKIGGVYGVSYETRNATLWRRGKLLDVTQNGPKDVRFKVFFLDYGNSQLVTRDRLKEIDLKTVKRAAFAKECQLTNPTDTNFDVNAHMHLLQIIRDKELFLQYIDRGDRTGGVQEVDLLVATSKGGYISVRDLLCTSSSQISEPTVNGSVLSSQLKLFKNSKTFTIGQEAQVVVTYIKDPSNVYVTLTENSQCIEKMKKSMEQFYAKMSPLGSIPVSDTDVIVNYEDEAQGKWHRAKITSVNFKNKEVDVYFVDWGYTSTVPWSSLRKLTENFIKIECQAIAVKLAHVDKLNEDGIWTPSCINYLREQISLDEQCKIVVSNNNPLEVALFQARPSADICVNSLLVEHNHAQSTGNISQTTHWPNMQKEEVKDEDDDLTCQMFNKSQKVLMDDDDNDDELNSGKKLQVRILHVQSPDLIYIRFNKDIEREEILHKELQIHYSAGYKNKTKDKWKPGEKCVVFDSVRNHYFRAKIKASSGANNYIVYLYDHARELKISTNSIYIQDPYFETVRDLAHKCRLAMIKPAGDGTKWPSLGIELLQRIFRQFKTIYIKSKEKLHNGSNIFGVIMWYCLATPAKALEPSKLKYISINKTLIESGLALNAPLGSCSHPKTVKFLDDADKDRDESEDCSDTNEFEKDSPKEKTRDWNEMITEDETQEECLTQKFWQPIPPLPNVEEFEGYLICVESGGILSIRDEDMQELYLDLEQKLLQQFKTIKIVPDLEWNVNDQCTVYYDEKWYRATVLDIVNDNEVNIEMIDFGSAHIVSKQTLSKYFMFVDIPPLIYKVQLYDVYSQYGDWTSEDVDSLVEITEDNVRVVIKGDRNDAIPSVEVYLRNGFSLNDLITRACSHMYRRKTQVILGDIEPANSNDELENQIVDNYHYIPLQNSSEGMTKLHIVNILKWDTSYNVVISSNDGSTNDDEIANLSIEIEKRINRQPTLQNIELNKPCACFHPEKQLWARAMVYSIASLKYGYVLVFFVDYGTVEMINVPNLKEMCSDWFYLPVHMYIATINVELLQKDQLEYVLMQLNSLRGRFVSVDIISESPLRVHLYDGKKLVYQNFVNCGILKICE